MQVSLTYDEMNDFARVALNIGDGLLKEGLFNKAKRFLGLSGQLYNIMNEMERSFMTHDRIVEMEPVVYANVMREVSRQEKAK